MAQCLENFNPQAGEIPALPQIFCVTLAKSLSNVSTVSLLNKSHILNSLGIGDHT